mgnify:FL=1
MDFKQIEAFVNVVKYRSFSKAADAMFFTQPTISTHVSNLELELGTKLLDRKGRTIELTPQGNVFYKFAIEMVNARERAIDAIEGAAHELGGTLEIQTSSVPGATFVPEVLADFGKEYPDVQYYVSLSDTQEVIENLSDRRGEIGFIGSKPQTRSFESLKVFSDSAVLLSNKSLGLGEKVSIKDVATLPLIWRESGSATRKAFEEAVAENGIDRASIRVVGLFDDLVSIFRGVESGLGVSVVSRRVAEAFASENIMISDISEFSENRDFYMINLKNVSLSPLAETFRNFVKVWVKK